MKGTNKTQDERTNLKKKIRQRNDKHIWKFSRVGGVNRVNLESGQDLIALESLDQKLWTVLSCPVYGLEIDSKTLELIDTDNDNRIRVPEILAAVKWICSVVKNPNDLLRENKTLPLSAINNNNEEGKILLNSARRILVNLGKPKAIELSVEDTSDTKAIFAGTPFNGDGVITEDSTSDETLKKLINDIISCIDSTEDLNGKPGITADHIQLFYEQCKDFSGWHDKVEANTSEILPYGDSTNAAYEAFMQIKPKVEDYFLRCRLVEFDADSVSVLNELNNQYEAFKSKNLSDCLEEIADFPIAKIEKGKKLPLSKGVNPAWEPAMETFSKLVVAPLMPDKKELSESEWQKIEDSFNAYQAWQSEKAGASVEPLGLTFVRELLSGNTQEQLLALIEQDKALEEDTRHIMLVDQLARYYRDLYKFLNNYVTFHYFYSPDLKAIFQSGNLYIDQRCCDLCVKVNDMPKHDLMARSSGICLLYCDCTSKVSNEKMRIVAALTDGDFDNIEVGRNALFYDREGRDWDATIVKVIENPISIRQAFWRPYRRMAKFISTQIEKFASSKDKAVEATATSKIEESGSKVGTTAANTPPAPPFDIAKFVGIFAAISLALGAIGSVVVSILTGFLSLSWWKMPLAILGIMLCISGPSMLLAWLKLRKRNLAPLLDANGWAINARATINIVFGKTLTHLASLPENARLNLVDPFAKKKNPFIFILIAFIFALLVTAVLLWHFDYIHLPWFNK